MDIYSRILENIEIPPFYKVHFEIHQDHIPAEALGHAVMETVFKSGSLENIQSGDSVAIAVGSREIAHLAVVVRKLGEMLRTRGARPFIFPAMGSHGGAEASAQAQILAGYGVTEAEMGIPVRATMETKMLGYTDAGLPVYFDRFACEADWVIPVARVKPHTDFRGPIESGILKMLVIGAGKQRGASVCHEAGWEQMSENIQRAARIILENVRVPFALAIVETADHRTHCVRAVPGERIFVEEPGLLRKARELLLHLPFEKLDIILLDEMGKDISGSGMDANVIGRSSVLGRERPFADKIAVFDLTENSHHNATGIGKADVITRKLFDKINLDVTYPNGITGNDLRGMMIPTAIPGERNVIRTAIKTCIGGDPVLGPRICWMHNTLCTTDFLVSQALLPDVQKNLDLSLRSDALYATFDGDGNFVDFVREEPTSAQEGTIPQ